MCVGVKVVVEVFVVVWVACCLDCDESDLCSVCADSVASFFLQRVCDKWRGMLGLQLALNSPGWSFTLTFYLHPSLYTYCIYVC